MEWVWRFLIGGSVVCGFAALGDVLRPKSFAGLFGAAPSVALATIGLTVAAHGRGYASVEARSMVLGAGAFFLYAWACCWVLLHREARSPVVTIGLLPGWFGVAFGLWFWLLRGRV
jgi:hypothetical protein